MIYISVVSHNHFGLIKDLGCLTKFKDSKNIKVIVRDNVGEIDFDVWCKSLNFNYTCNNRPFGFGKNNNLNFECAKELGCADNDHFLIMNPDILCSEDSILQLRDRMLEIDAGLATLNLFLDDNFHEFDNCVRRFPGLSDFIMSFLFGFNNTILIKSELESVSKVDWAAGSFLMFSRSSYEKLCGFDERYFMYCEDIDICMRYAKAFGSKMFFFRDIYAVHYARRENRRLLSRHFFWHLTSATRYLLRRTLHYI